MNKRTSSLDYAARMSRPEKQESRWVDRVLWAILISIAIASVLVSWFKIHLN